MKCIYCNTDMRIDDVDIRFKGNKDVYYECDNCETACCEEIRYYKAVLQHWVKSNGEVEIINPQLNIFK